jgi:hypothetical protein
VSRNGRPVQNRQTAVPVLPSPTGRESSDKIAVWDDLTLAYERVAGGFHATVTRSRHTPMKMGLAPIRTIGACPIFVGRGDRKS